MTAFTDAEILRRIENLLEMVDNNDEFIGLPEDHPNRVTRQRAQEAYEVLWRRVNGKDVR